MEPYRYSLCKTIYCLLTSKYDTKDKMNFASSSSRQKMKIILKKENLKPAIPEILRDKSASFE